MAGFPWRYLFSVAMMKLNNTPLAGDMLQDTFVCAIKAAPNFKEQCWEKTWLQKKSVLKETQDYVEQTELSFAQNFTESGPGAIPHWLDDTY